MAIDQKALEKLIAKDEIRELVLLYSRGCDRKDFELLRALYTRDGTDSHDETFTGSADDYVAFLARSLPHAPYSGHHVCNHLISVDVDAGTGEGEVYAVAYHIIPDRKGGWNEDFMCVRYVDRYRREDARWRFAQRVVTYDMRTVRPYVATRAAPDPLTDASYTTLSSRLFARGPRA
jgi:hypothetical protein